MQREKMETAPGGVIEKKSILKSVATRPPRPWHARSSPGIKFQPGWNIYQHVETKNVESFTDLELEQGEALRIFFLLSYGSPAF